MDVQAPYPDEFLGGAEECEEARRRRVAAGARALQTLPAVCRQVFVLRVFDDLAYGIIAQRLGISETDAERHLARGLEVLTAAMEEHDAEEARRAEADGK